jgi:hypothetical protein
MPLAIPDSYEASVILMYEAIRTRGVLTSKETSLAAS